MSEPMSTDLSGFSMLELFRAETDNQKAVLTSGLLEIEKHPGNAAQLEALMRAAHSLKGAARIVGLDAAVRVAHAMEDVFEAVRKNPDSLAGISVAGLPGLQAMALKYRGQSTFISLLVDLMLDGVDLLGRIAGTPEADIERWSGEAAPEITAYVENVAALMALDGQFAPPAAAPPSEWGFPEATAALPVPETITAPPSPPGASPAEPDAAERSLRITTENLNRLLALAGESQVEARRLRPFTEGLVRLKRQLSDLNCDLDDLRETLAQRGLHEETGNQLHALHENVTDTRQLLTDRLADLENLGRRVANISGRMYGAALACRMRPFADGVRGFPRMVRDLSRRLGKEVELEILGEETQVDRDILESLEPVITQLLRNALDHGIEPPEERVRHGKPRQGRLRLEARHNNGKLLVSVSDDGRGVADETLRQAVVARGLATPATAAQLSGTELLEFLFLPGFSLKESVSEISGRGVGLDVVMNMAKGARGTVRIHSTPGAGMRFQLQLPLTLSVLRMLLVEIAGEPYALPLASVQRTLKVAPADLDTTGGRPRLSLDGRTLELAPAHELLGRTSFAPLKAELPVLVLGERDQTCGLIVDEFRGERELVVQPLDPRLGKVRDIAAGALMEDGAPVLILDVDDLLRSAERLFTAGATREGGPRAGGFEATTRRRRVLVVDDSLTVRQIERKVLQENGYDVELAVDGMDGWNAVRAGEFDLVITDFDMPRMNGTELTARIKADPALRSLPVLMITYKDREADRQQGLRAGADHYLTKGSFQDESFLRTVRELIGGPLA